MSNEIIPALLPKSPEELTESLSELPREVEYFHLDVLETDVWTEIDRGFEAHLMVANPGIILERWVNRGAKRIIVHKLNGVELFRGKVEIGLGVELDVPIEEALSQVSEVDFLHLMSIAEIGEQGHPFDERIFDRIRKVKGKFPQIPISVDGGINTTNYQALIDAGVDRLIVGSRFKELWQSQKKG